MVLHQDERYYAMGLKGGVLKRMAYSASRILITPNYEGHQTFSASEVFGRAMAQGISLSYYQLRSSLSTLLPMTCRFNVLATSKL
jgi:hypothetical protein